MNAASYAQLNSQRSGRGGPGQNGQHLRRLYRRARDRGRRGQWWARLTGQPGTLLDLASVEANCKIQVRSTAGIQAVALDQIRGSAGRSRYFDRDFRPLHDEARGRWLGIARARQQGKRLPPIQLVQVCAVYFVRDGHHRISVARALGQRHIEARVTVWHVSGPSACASPAEPVRRGLADRVRGIGAALKTRWLSGSPGNVPPVSGTVLGC